MVKWPARSLATAPGMKTDPKVAGAGGKQRIDVERGEVLALDRSGTSKPAHEPVKSASPCPARGNRRAD